MSRADEKKQTPEQTPEQTSEQISEQIPNRFRTENCFTHFSQNHQITVTCGNYAIAVLKGTEYISHEKKEGIIVRKMGVLTAAVMVAALSLSTITGCAATTANAETVAAVTAADTQSNEKQKPEDFLQKLVSEGKLTQEKYEAIQTYLKENAPEKPEGMEERTPDKSGKEQTPPEKKEGGKSGQKGDGQTPPEKPEGTGNGQTPPEKPEGTGDGHEPGMMLSAEMLEKLLANSIITQAEYETIKAVLPEMPEKPEKPSGSENASAASAG